MGGESYYVVVDEVHSIECGYIKYKSEMDTALSSLNKSVQRVLELDTFQGVAAQSIKAYFEEAHMRLIALLGKLVEQLKTDYEKEYGPGFFNSPVSASLGACIPEQGLKDVEKALTSMLDGDLAEASKGVSRAIASLPSSVSFSKPDERVVKMLIEGERKRIGDIRRGVRALEDAGVSTFGAQHGAFANFSASLSAAIAACAESAIPISAYVSGGFDAIAESTGLKTAYRSCVQDQMINQDRVNEAQSMCLDREAARIKAEQEKERWWKEQWATVGFALSVVTLLASAAVVVATAGVAAPALGTVVATAFSTLSCVKAGADVLSRSNQVSQIMGGNYRADHASLGSGEEGKMAEGGFKQVAKTAVGFYDKGFNQDSIDKYSKGATHYMAKETVRVFSGWLSDSMEGDGAKAGVDTTAEIVEGSLDIYLSKAGDSSWCFDINGAPCVISTISKAAGIAVDYFADLADQKLEDLDNQSKQLEEIRANANSQPSYMSNIDW